MGHGREPTAGRGVVEGAFALLEELAQTGESGLTRLAAGAGLPKATAHRLLDQLVAVGAVVRQNGRYRVGPQLFRLGQAWQPAPVLRTAAQHPLRELALATSRASVGVVMPDAGRVLIVGGMRGEVDEIMPQRAGVVLGPGSAAEMVLATDSPGAPPPECYSASEWARLIASAREDGMAFDHESFPVVSCVAAPVHAPSGKVVAAVGAVVLKRRRLASMAADVRRAADMVSANLARPSAGQQALSPGLDRGR